MFTENNGMVEIVQENHFYPFGMQMNGNWHKTQNVKNDYLYNGKELNTDIGLNWSDYGFRYYDAAIGRFTGVDPISEKFPHVTTYNYAENEPVAGLDLWALQRADFNTYSDPGIQAYLNEQGRSTLTKEEYELIAGPSAKVEGAMLAVGSLFVPGPEDVVLGAFAITKVGKVLSKFADDIFDGVKGLFKSGDEVADVLVDVKNPFLKKSKSDLIDDKNTFTKMIKEHKSKLNEFKKDPIGNSSDNWLKTATKDNPTNEELLKRANGRINALEKQIKKQEGELNKIIDALKTK